MAGRNEYALGLAHVQENTPPANANVAYMAGHNEYALGLMQAQASLAAASVNVAYMMGFDQYNEGMNAAQSSKKRKMGASFAYTQGYDDHRS